jgi:hypothetical protein
MISVLAFVVVILVAGFLAYHGVGAFLDARLARKELDQRIRQLELVADSVSRTEGRRARLLVERLLDAVRDEPTARLG